MPIGIYFTSDIPFTNNEIKTEKGDCIYLFSDGYADQFGGSQEKKFMISRLRNLLIEIHKYPMLEQKVILEKAFISWKMDLEQVDDILIMGIKV